MRNLVIVICAIIFLVIFFGLAAYERNKVERSREEYQRAVQNPPQELVKPILPIRYQNW